MLKINDLRAKIILATKGFAMGIADIIPGVSGGTIAFITGIYENLIAAINSVKISHAVSFLKLIFFIYSPQQRRQNLSELASIHWGFIIPLATGILSAVLLMARIIPDLLEKYPFYMYSLFFGLIVFSIPLVFRKMNRDLISHAILFFFAVIMFILMGPLQGFGGSSSLPYVFLSGALAICAMVLPGISGSYILVIMGQYVLVLEALKNNDVLFMAVFVCGIIIGLLSFAKLLKFLLNRYNSATMAALTGIMAGSLRAIWPVEHMPESAGNTTIIFAIALMLAGGAIITTLNKVSMSNKH